MAKLKRPTKCTDDHLAYLDNLRESGVTNMFGAASYLHDYDGFMTIKEAREILKYWMDTFGDGGR